MMKSINEIVDLASAYYGSAVLFAAIDRGVFAAVEKSGAFADVVKATGGSERGMRLLLDACVAEGLLEIADGAFDGAALAELVVPASVRAVGALDLTELKTLRFLGKPDSIGDIRLSPDCIVYVPQDAGWTAVPSANWHGAQLEYWVDFARTVANGEATITGCAAIPPDRRLRIPETLDGVPVTAIGAEAFYGCDGLTAVEFPASLVRLGRGVFGDAGKPSGLTSLTFNGDAPDYDAEIGLGFSHGHADAVVADGDGALVLVDVDADAVVLTVETYGIVGEGHVPQLVDGVGCVGNYLTQENLLVCVN